MNLKNKNIKLIVSDVDNTLVKESTMALNPEYLEVFKKLIDKGYKIGIASGRQYIALRAMFDSIKDGTFFLSENGCQVILDDKPLFQKFIDKNLVYDIIEQSRINDLGIAVATTPKGSYLEVDDQVAFKKIEKGLKNSCHIIDDLHTIENECLKIAFLCNERLEERLKFCEERYKDKLTVSISGYVWYDLTNMKGNKGEAVRFVKNYLNIDKSETCVFGDNFNDIPMLDEAEYSFVSELSNDEVKKHGKELFESYEKCGVLKILKTLLLG